MIPQNKENRCFFIYQIKRELERAASLIIQRFSNYSKSFFLNSGITRVKNKTKR